MHAKITFPLFLIALLNLCCLHARIHASWRSLADVFDEPCSLNSVCGVNSLCSSTNNETSSCSCLPGFIPVDEKNLSKGCHPETLINYCEDHSRKNFTVQVINDTDFPAQDFEDLSRIMNSDLESCKKAVMEDCYTMAASLEDSTCYTKRYPLLNARKTASTIGIRAIIKVPMSTGDPDFRKDKRKRRISSKVVLKIGLIVIATLAFLLGATAAYYHPVFRRLMKRKRCLNVDAIGVGFREFTFQELGDATNGFGKVLGRGSSGKVYSGRLRLKDVEIEIAVKKLEKEIEKSEKEFMTELKIIGRTYHKNLVRLLGFCVEKDQRLLVYEFMANGALSKFLFGEGDRPNWSQRADIAIGIARGLLYLHEECETQIIHCDIKPENVLLDMNFTPKIADFGLSKLLNRDQTRTDTNIRGTMGYMAPEWLRFAPVTSKVDVFSFGVMLFEIICGRRHIELSRVEEESEADDLVLSDWILSCLMSGKLEKVVQHDPDVLDDFKRFERMCLVGLWCISPEPLFRPSMKKITQMLEGTIEVGVPPQLYDNQ